MIELFFVACLRAEPQVCHDQSLLFQEQNGVFTCLILGQRELARWSETHPRELVREWKCRRPHDPDQA